VAYVRHVTLTANTVQTFTLTDNSSAFEVLNRNGLAEVYVSYDGTASPANPTVGGNDFDVVPPAVGAGIRCGRTGTAPIVVKVISAQATAVSFRSIA
jgi:hypothetical protein